MRRNALDAYMARKAEIDTMLARLTALSDDHFGVGPDEINVPLRRWPPVR